MLLKNLRFYLLFTHAAVESKKEKHDEKQYRPDMGPRQHCDRFRVRHKSEPWTPGRHWWNWKAGLMWHETDYWKNDETGEDAGATIQNRYQNWVTVKKKKQKCVGVQQEVLKSEDFQWVASSKKFWVTLTKIVLKINGIEGVVV